MAVFRGPFVVLEIELVTVQTSTLPLYCLSDLINNEVIKNSPVKCERGKDSAGFISSVYHFIVF